MSTYPEECLKTIIENVAVTNKIENYDYSLNEFENIGQNYFGVLIPILLKGRRANENVNLHLVMKLAPTDERYRVSGALTLFFAKEIFVYSTLFSAYNELQNADVITKFIFPKCYYVEKKYCKEALVIEDMRAKGYKLYNEMYLDYNHTVSSIIELSKLHALSFILKKNKPSFYEEVVKICEPLNPDTNKRFMDILDDRLDKVVAVFRDTKYVKFLQDLRSNYVKCIDDLVNGVNGTVVCHGDIWKENILFSNTNGEIKACLIDYQTARISSPAFDILFLLMTSTSSHNRKTKFNEIIDIYYKNFKLTFVDSGNSDVYSYSDFYSDLKVCVLASFIVANTAIWLSTGMQQEGHVRSKIITKTEQDVIIATNTYKNRIMEVLDDFCELGFWDF